MAVEALSEDPSVIGAKPRDELLKGLYSLHVARQGRKGRYFIMFRVAPAGDAIEVLRLLHDSMDLPRHIPDMDGRPSARVLPSASLISMQARSLSVLGKIPPLV